MRKIILLLSMSLAFVTAVNAQVTFMPKAGASYSNVAFSNDLKDAWDADFGSKLGFVVGVAAEIPLGGEKFALQPELLFLQKGYHYEYENTDLDYSEDYNYTLNYLEIPVLAKLKFGKFYVAAGPSFGIGLMGQYNGSYTYLGQKTDDKGKVKFGKEPDNYEGDDEYIENGFDVGVQIGAGVKISPVVIDLRYGLGLTDLYDKPQGFTGDYSAKNRCLQLTIGFPLGSKSE